MTDFSRSLLDANLEAFYQRYPQDRERISHIASTPFVSNFELKDKKGSLTLIQAGRVVDQAKLDHPLNLDTQDRPARIVVLEGFGLGSTLRESLKNSRPETLDILVLEPSTECFLMALGTSDFREQLLDSKIHWIIGLKDNASFYRIFSLLRDQERSTRISSRVYIRHPHSAAENHDFYQSIENQWQSHIETVQNFFGSPEDAILGLQNTFQNLKFIEDYPGVDLLKDIFASKPAIIISTGPSLAKSLDSIRKAQDTAVLIAADASLKILLDHGITPHFVATLERLETEPFFQNLKFPDEKVKSNLVAYPLAPKAALDLYTGPKWVTYRSYDYYGFFSGQARKGWLSTGHSVSHLCIGLAQHLGCKRIALVGQDLSYDPDTLASHPKGISYDEWSKSLTEEEFKKTLKARGEELFWVKGNTRDRVPTSSIYIVYLQELIDQIQSSPDFSFVNCTEGGVKIGDIPHQALDEFLKNDKVTVSIFQQIAAFYGTYAKNVHIDVSSIRAYLKQALGYLNAGLEVARSPEALGRIQDLRHLQGELKKDRPFFAFVVHQMARATAELEDEWNLISGAGQATDSKRLKILSRWFEKSKEIAERVERLVP